MKVKNLLNNVKLTAATGLAALAMTSASFAAQPSQPQSVGNDIPALTRQIEKSKKAAYSQLSNSNSERQGDFYLMGGQGVASPGGNTQFYLETGLREHITQNISAGFSYINEGHPDLNIAGHRDGFALTGWYRIMIGNKLRIEAGAGPYLSMNTIWRDDPKQEYNDKNIGLLTALALVYPLGRGINLRAQINEVIMPGSFNTTALTLGLGTDLGGKLDTEQFSKAKNNYALSIMGSLNKTTRGGGQNCTGFELELQRKISDRFAYSISGISEGDSGVSDRTGAASQIWFIAPKLGLLEFSAGLGPYVAQENNPDDKGIKLLGLGSMRAKVYFNDDWYALLERNRVISGYDKDEDMTRLGIGKEF